MLTEMRSEYLEGEPEGLWKRGKLSLFRGLYLELGRSGKHPIKRYLYLVNEKMLYEQ